LANSPRARSFVEAFTPIAPIANSRARSQKCHTNCRRRPPTGGCVKPGDWETAMATLINISSTPLELDQTAASQHNDVAYPSGLSSEFQTFLTNLKNSANAPWITSAELTFAT